MSENTTIPEAGPHAQTTAAPHTVYLTQSPQQVEAEKAAQMSLVFGILGLFLLGIVFGPLAIVQANKAERLGKAATAGKVLGWISTVLSVLALAGLVIMVAGGALMMSGGAAVLTSA